jgi:ABC-2 type transport system ATP-binding protein
MKAISANELTKVYGKLTAVDHITFEVEEGESFGILGLNGAGKTTTLMMLSTLLRPTSGSAKVFGYDIVRQSDEVRRFIGVVFEERAVDIQLTGRQNLDLHARMYYLGDEERRKKVTEVLAEVGLEKFADVKVDDYSGGMLRRLEIARSMIADPRLLILDEPTIGVDVQTRRYLWDHVKRLNKEHGISVLLATSYAEEADYLCDRVAIMHQGKLVAVGTPEELKAAQGENIIRVKPAVSTDEEKWRRLVETAGWAEKVENSDGWLELKLKDGRVGIPQVVRFARDNGLAISGISSHKPTLNDVVLRYVGDGGRAQ